MLQETQAACPSSCSNSRVQTQTPQETDTPPPQHHRAWHLQQHNDIPPHGGWSGRISKHHPCIPGAGVRTMQAASLRQVSIHPLDDTGATPQGVGGSGVRHGRANGRRRITPRAWKCHSSAPQAPPGTWHKMDPAGDGLGTGQLRCPRVPLNKYILLFFSFFFYLQQHLLQPCRGSRAIHAFAIRSRHFLGSL
jgi:hypothetical protein